MLFSTLTRCSETSSVGFGPQARGMGLQRLMGPVTMMLSPRQQRGVVSWACNFVESEAQNKTKVSPARIKGEGAVMAVRWAISCVCHRWTKMGNKLSSILFNILTITQQNKSWLRTHKVPGTVRAGKFTKMNTTRSLACRAGNQIEEEPHSMSFQNCTVSDRIAPWRVF